MPTPSPEAKGTETRKRFGLQETPAKPQPEDERVEVTLARVEQGGDGKLVLTTTEGAVWRQVESDAIRPMPSQGQTMKIARTTLGGGFICEATRRVAFRCFRSR